MQAYLMHQFVHDEGRPGHISGVLHQGNKEIQNQDVGQENQDASGTGDEAVYHQVFQPAVRHDGAHALAQFAHQPVYPVHRVLPQGEGRLENHVQEQDEDGEGQPAVRYQRIDLVGPGTARPLRDVRLVHLGQGTLHKGIFCIDDGALGPHAQQLLQALLLLETGGDQFIATGPLLQDPVHLFVVLQEFDGQPAGGVVRRDVAVPPKQVLQAVDALFQFHPVVDVDVARQARIVLFVYRDEGVQQVGDPLAGAAHRGTDRHAQQPSELLQVQLVTFPGKLIEHIQRHDHPQVHVDELGGQVQVALQVGSVHHIEYDIGNGFDQGLPDIAFFRAVGRQGIGPRQVHQHDFVILIGQAAFAGIHRYAGIIPHVLVAARRHVEKRSFPAIRIAHQGHADHMVPFLGHMFQRPVEPLGFRHIRRQSLQVFVADKRLEGLSFAHHLDPFRLFAPEGKPITQHFIFDGVLQRGVQDHADLLPANEAHLNQAFAETTVAVHLDDDRLFSGMQVGQRHSRPSGMIKVRVRESSSTSTTRSSCRGTRTDPGSMYRQGFPGMSS